MNIFRQWITHISQLWTPTEQEIQDHLVAAEAAERIREYEAEGERWLSEAPDSAISHNAVSPADR